MARRKIVQIDEEKCDGCGLCIPACAEGALRIVGGKARLVGDVYCDGLGACLGECPQDAITIIEREAEQFDEEIVQHHLAPRQAAGSATEGRQKRSSRGCPGSTVVGLEGDVLRPEASASGLRNWPVQLHLVPPHAPFLKQADLLLVADCVPFAMGDFHGKFLGTRPVVIGCPKLDDANFYVEKLAQIITAAEIHSLTVVHMEVPCCTGLVRIAQGALDKSGRDLPLEDVAVSIRGRIIPPGA